MTTRLITGARSWTPLTRDAEGHRQFIVKHLVEADTDDGPFTVLQTPGLPLPGSAWNYGNDLDLWATCLMTASVTVHQEKEGDPTTVWLVENTYSTKPPDLKKCSTEQPGGVEDPLLQPAKVSGSFVSERVEATHDRFGFPVANSAHEQIRGPQVEFDESHITIKIEQNVSTLYQAATLPNLLMNSVNHQPLWGFDARCVRLANGSFERKFYGNCSMYYSRVLEFICDARTHDRNILDEGTKALFGGFDSTGVYVLTNIDGQPPNPANPTHFKLFQDLAGNACRVILNGFGLPADVMVGVQRLFVSIDTPNIGFPLTNSTYWIPLESELTGDIETATWRAGADYVTGNLVVLEGVTYVATRPSWNNDPRGALGWVQLPDGVTSKGDYNAATSYALGDYVRPAGTTIVGNRHIEKYPSANLLLLGIPTVF